jgi:hypothetical protein
MNQLDIGLTRVWFGRELPQRQVAYTSDNLPEFIGWAVRGKATSAAAWQIIKLAYDSSNNMTSTKSALRDSVWDNRASLTFS